MTGRNRFEKNRGIIYFLAKIFAFLGRKINYRLLVFFRYKTGNIGILIRYILIKNLAKSVGDNVSIQPGVYLFNLQNIEFGNNVSVHPMCYLEGAGGIGIGNNVSIAHSTSILSTNHTWNDISLPIKYNKETYSSVFIEDDVWVGCGCRILAGVTIESRAVVAAGAVLNKNVNSNTVVGGIPAKEIKKISDA